MTQENAASSENQEEQIAKEQTDQAIVPSSNIGLSEIDYETQLH